MLSPSELTHCDACSACSAKVFDVLLAGTQELHLLQDKAEAKVAAMEARAEEQRRYGCGIIPLRSLA